MRAQKHERMTWREREREGHECNSMKRASLHHVSTSTSDNAYACLCTHTRKHAHARTRAHARLSAWHGNWLAESPKSISWHVLRRLKAGAAAGRRGTLRRQAQTLRRCPSCHPHVPWPSTPGHPQSLQPLPRNTAPAIVTRIPHPFPSSAFAIHIHNPLPSSAFVVHVHHPIV